MNRRFASVCAASALGYLLTACKDSTTTPGSPGNIGTNQNVIIDISH